MNTFKIFSENSNLIECNKYEIMSNERGENFRPTFFRENFSLQKVSKLDNECIKNMSYPRLDEPTGTLRKPVWVETIWWPRGHSKDI